MCHPPASTSQVACWLVLKAPRVIRSGWSLAKSSSGPPLQTGYKGPHSALFTPFLPLSLPDMIWERACLFQGAQCAFLFWMDVPQCQEQRSQTGGSLWVPPLVPVREKRKLCKRGWAQLGQHVTSVQTQLRNTMLPRLSAGTGSVSEDCQVTAKKPPSASAAVPASPALNNPCKQNSALPAQPQMGLPF